MGTNMLKEISIKSDGESDENSKVKHKKTDADERAHQIILLNENISTLESRVKYKQQLLQKAQSVNNFKLCDDISGDIISVRKELRIAESQLSAIKKKQVKSEWYHNKKHEKNKDKLTKKEKININRASLCHPLFVISPVLQARITKQTRKMRASNAKRTVQFPSILTVYQVAQTTCAFCLILKIFKNVLPISQMFGRMK